MKAAYICWICLVIGLPFSLEGSNAGRDKAREKRSTTSSKCEDERLRSVQLEKQYQDLMREMEQKEQDHALEVNQLKDEMYKLREEMESMLVELQTLMDTKQSLELEIAAYRKLLETEESR